MSDKSKKREGGPPEIIVNDDLEFEHMKETEKDGLLTKKSVDAPNYGSLMLESTGET
jgi:hypothetical protein